MGDLQARTGSLVPALTKLYEDLHRNPELSFQEQRTAGIVADRLEALGLDVTRGVGRTGVVGVLRNGGGPVVALRADMDALPVAEQTGLSYASTARGVGVDGAETPVAHACGHDMHVTCLLGAVGVHGGPSFAATDAIHIILHGQGGHGSRPEAAIDPVVMAASTVMRLQTVVSRTVAATDAVVLTVGSIQAGAKDNIIPDRAELKGSIRTFDNTTRAAALEAVRRIVNAEAAASGAPRAPEIIEDYSAPVVFNDPDAAERTRAAFAARFGDDAVIDPGPATGSEDVGTFATASGAPCCYWLLGGADPKAYAAAVEAGTVSQDIPANHSPHYAPVPDPTIQMGVTALATAATTWLGRPDPADGS